MKIGIDLDDVVVDYTRGFCDFYNRRYGTNFSIEDFKSQRIWETIGGNLWSAVGFVREFYKTDFFDEIKLIEGAGEGIKKLSENHRLYIITARFKQFRKKTEKSLEKYFNNPDLKLFFSGFFNGARKKLEICKKQGIKLIIEDNKDYALKCAENGIRVFLFDKPWNQGDSNGIIRVYNWNEILEKINKLNRTDSGF